MDILLSEQRRRRDRACIAAQLRAQQQAKVDAAYRYLLDLYATAPSASSSSPAGNQQGGRAQHREGFGAGNYCL